MSRIALRATRLAEELEQLARDAVAAGACTVEDPDATRVDLDRYKAPIWINGEPARCPGHGMNTYWLRPLKKGGEDPMKRDINSLLKLNRQAREKATQLFDVVHAYLSVTKEEGEQPARIVAEYLYRDAPNWMAAAEWILAFDPRPYLQRFRQQGGYREDTGDDYEREETESDPTQDLAERES